MQAAFRGGILAEEYTWKMVALIPLGMSRGFRWVVLV